MKAKSKNRNINRPAAIHAMKALHDAAQEFGIAFRVDRDRRKPLITIIYRNNKESFAYSPFNQNPENVARWVRQNVRKFVRRIDSVIPVEISPAVAKRTRRSQ